MNFLYYLVLLLVLHALKPMDQASDHGQLVMPPLNVMIGPSYRTCYPEALNGILQLNRQNVSDILSEILLTLNVEMDCQFGIE